MTRQLAQERLAACGPGAGAPDAVERRTPCAGRRRLGPSAGACAGGIGGCRSAGARPSSVVIGVVLPSPNGGERRAAEPTSVRRSTRRARSVTRPGPAARRRRAPGRSTLLRDDAAAGVAEVRAASPAEATRWSPITHSLPGGTSTSKRTVDGAGRPGRGRRSSSGTPLTVIRPAASQHATGRRRPDDALDEVLLADAARGRRRPAPCARRRVSPSPASTLGRTTVGAVEHDDVAAVDVVELVGQLVDQRPGRRRAGCSPSSPTGCRTARRGRSCSTSEGGERAGSHAGRPRDAARGRHGATDARAAARVRRGRRRRCSAAQPRRHRAVRHPTARRTVGTLPASDAASPSGQRRDQRVSSRSP